MSAKANKKTTEKSAKPKAKSKKSTADTTPPASVETHQFGAETGKILHLMIHSLYTNKDIFLRELISNASDACDKLHYLSLTNPALVDENTEFKITIDINSDDGILSISDNGIGMDKADLLDHLGTIARSGTERFFEQAKGDSKKSLELIGQFGVGFYSSFMVADDVLVISRKAGDNKTWVWNSDGKGTFKIEESAEERAPGTTIRLHMKEDERGFLDTHRIRHIVRTYSDHISYPVELTEKDEKPQVINEASALWTRPQKDISEEQYEEFYRHVSHAGDKPWMTLHNKVEGGLEYTNLLFIPSHKPFDLFHPDRTTRVKLYVKRVFISESNVDVIPRHLRFVRGIVDSQDLPLNISRETLQHNNLLHKIRNSITKKILSELKKKANNDAEGYVKFWENFGPVVKEGLCEGIDANRESLLEICRFHSTHSTEQLTGLDDYIARMNPKQTKIYYLIGDNINALRGSPQLEAFLKKGIEVLLLADSVDDFWVNTTHEFKEKEIVSITRSGVELDEVVTDKPETKDSSTNAEHQERNQKLVEFLKETLKGKVFDVVISAKLSDSPVCLSSQEGAMDMRMERFLVSQNQLPSATLKVLEINPDHGILQYIANHAHADNAKDLAVLLFEQACIIEGEQIPDPSGFAKRFNQFLQDALGK